VSAGHCNIHCVREGFALRAAFEIPARGVLGVFGVSGAGKTTLLRCIAGLEPAARGEIRIGAAHWLQAGRSLPVHRRRLGYVFQDGRLFPHRTVAQNLDYGRRRRPPAVDDAGIAREQLLDLLALGKLLQRFPHELSGGEMQRVAIARALLAAPALLLLDEPLASLDEARKQDILPYLERLHDALHIPMLYVSHSLAELTRLCDSVLVLERGELVYQGDIRQALIAPDSPLSHLRDASCLLDCWVSGHDTRYDLTTVHTASGNKFQLRGRLPAGQHTRLRILASDVSLCTERPLNTSILNILQGTVVRTSAEADASVLVTVRSREDDVLARISLKSRELLAIEPGREVYVQIKAIALSR
jgi:molybdate transport system ATP-binding protein